jgi:hypothetical protein
VPRKTLTQTVVDRLTPPISGRLELFDTQCPGFGLRVSTSGRKTWFVMYRVGGSLVRETLGTNTNPSQRVRGSSAGSGEPFKGT